MKKHRVIILVISLLLLTLQVAYAEEYYAPMQGSNGYQEVSVTSATAVGLPAAFIANLYNQNTSVMARIYVTGFPVAFLSNGTAPTSATVQQLAVGDYYFIHSIAEMRSFQAIGIGGTATIAVQGYVMQRAQ